MSTELAGPLEVRSNAGLERSRTLHQVRVAMGFYAVPCNGCTACCHDDAVRILPHEDASRWQTEPHPYMAGALMLAHKPNGDCIYLGEGGCTRQADKPQQCHEMDISSTRELLAEDENESHTSASSSTPSSMAGSSRVVERRWR